MENNEVKTIDLGFFISLDIAKMFDKKYFAMDNKFNNNKHLNLRVQL